MAVSNPCLLTGSWHPPPLSQLHGLRASMLFLIPLAFLSHVANQSSHPWVSSLSYFSNESFSSHFHGSHTFFLPPATSFCLFSNNPSLLCSLSEPKLGFPENQYQLPVLASRTVSPSLFYKALVLRDSHE